MDHAIYGNAIWSTSYRIDPIALSSYITRHVMPKPAADLYGDRRTVRLARWEAPYWCELAVDYNGICYLVFDLDDDTSPAQEKQIIHEQPNGWASQVQVIDQFVTVRAELKQMIRQQQARWTPYRLRPPMDVTLERMGNGMAVALLPDARSLFMALGMHLRAGWWDKKTPEHAPVALRRGLLKLVKYHTDQAQKRAAENRSRPKFVPNPGRSAVVLNYAA
jgi:hypothetical protein